jgi:hypothetical protein
MGICLTLITTSLHPGGLERKGALIKLGAIEPGQVAAARSCAMAAYCLPITAILWVYGIIQ